MADLRYAGIGWPENAGGEHPSADYILMMPGIKEGCTLLCAPSARYWYAKARAASPLVVWRSIPRQGKLPAQLGWEPNRVADECLNLWDEQPHGDGTEWLLPLNELEFERESGEPFVGYEQVARHLAGLRLQLRRKIAQRYPDADVKLMFPAWVPGDDIAYADAWRSEALLWDAVCLHVYGSADEMEARYRAYRRTVGPTLPIFIGEWNANHTGADERASLLMFERLAREDPNLLGVCYFIWETRNQGEEDLSIWGNGDRFGLFSNPYTSGILAPTPEPIPSPDPEPIPSPPETPSMTEIEQFIRTSASMRGINPDIAVRVAKSEGGVTEPAKRGTFATGSSWWPFQLHYGGVDTPYAYLGTVAGMGNSFTELTGWSPGDPKAWRDSVRYALNRARKNGWGAWYGAKAIGITGFDGIDRSVPWEPNAEPWDYETGSVPVVPPPETVRYNAEAPRIAQNDDWSCGPTSTRWAMTALGRAPTEQWIESTMIAEGVVSTTQGILDATGAGIAAFIRRQYGEFGYTAEHHPTATFQFLADTSGTSPMLIGGRGWDHWSGLRGYDRARDVLILANPADGWRGVSQTMTRQQFETLGPFSAVTISHPDLVGPSPAPAPVPSGPDPRDLEIAALKAQLADANSRLGVAAVDYANGLQDLVTALRALKP